ncbi:hypothetical protein Taro_025034 [Colocasia esculenta]|uniref:Uncharacterized protein n=1 Tax=Colocasia esculenta TaxID=4460 RepID=A0A843V244_COLES|nr:hypothetical protein [Colocasia esculenta]
MSTSSHLYSTRSPIHVRPRMTHTLTRKGMTKSEAMSTLESLCYLRVVGCVEELLVVGEQEIKHTKLISFPGLSATTCVNHPLGVDQSEMLTGHGECSRDPV